MSSGKKFLKTLFPFSFWNHKFLIRRIYLKCFILFLSVLMTFLLYCSFGFSVSPFFPKIIKIYFRSNFTLFNCETWFVLDESDFRCYFIFLLVFFPLHWSPLYVCKIRKLFSFFFNDVLDFSVSPSRYSLTYVMRVGFFLGERMRISIARAY